ncbi:MAG: M48 family metalloprotease [Deltaproteobacteria bacterium]|nr:M48 family metalloprotease [Deltaproteobacteria bacterium]
MRRAFSLGLLTLVLATGACKRSTPVPTYPGPGYGPGYASPSYGAPPGTLPGTSYPAPGPGAPPTGPYPGPTPTPQAPRPTTPPTAGWSFPLLFPIPGLTPPPTQPTPAQPGPAQPSGSLPPVYADPINSVDIQYMRVRSEAVLGELRAALPQNHASAVASVPFYIDDTPGDVNAFAACTEHGPLMAITEGLLEISAQMARAKATDEFFGTNKLREYTQLVSQKQQPEQPIVRPAPGFFDPNQDADGRKVARQHDLFDEQVAFILGHELAHHYLQHTGCVGRQGGGISPADLGRVLSNAVPVLNQPNELASDTNGVVNVLNAGRARSGTKWHEEGAMMTLQFFVALMQMDPTDRLLFAFQGSHPPPELRIPVVQQAAHQWRASGGTSGASPLPLPLPLPFPFPFPGG